MKKLAFITNDKSKLNLVIDLVLFLLMMPIAGMGLLIKYVLIPGNLQNEIYGRSVNLEFLGLDRHQWGTVHLGLSLLFLILLVLHIVLHWRMISAISQRMIPDLRLRRFVTFLFVVSSIIFIAFPLMVQPSVSEKELKYKNRVKVSSVDADSQLPKDIFGNYSQSAEEMVIQPDENPESNEKQQSIDDKYRINGKETLTEVAHRHGVPINILAADLEIPANLAQERLGRLKKRYSFQIDDVRKSIAEYKKRER